jgi:hypothetical protein
MVWIIIVVFTFQGHLTSLYMGEAANPAECVTYANENFGKVVPNVKDAFVLCTPKRTT